MRIRKKNQRFFNEDEDTSYSPSKSPRKITKPAVGSVLSCYLSRLMTKPKKMTLRPAKTQISLGIRCAQWVAEDAMFLHADSEDSDQTGRTPRLIWVFDGRTWHFVGFVMRRLNCSFKGIFDFILSCIFRPVSLVFPFDPRLKLCNEVLIYGSYIIVTFPEDLIMSGSVECFFKNMY